jgi:hypothetical protein
VFVLGNGLVTGWSFVQRVLPTVRDWDTEVERNVSQMPYALSGSNRNKDKKKDVCTDMRLILTLDTYDNILTRKRLSGLYCSDKCVTHI